MNRILFNSAVPQHPLSEMESEVIAIFIDLVRWFGAPKSLGAIYGLLFVSKSPICFEQISSRLQMSNGSVSQGLRILKDVGAVKVTFIPGERRDFFVAETQLRQLVAGFLRRQVERQLVSGEGRLSRLFDKSIPVDSDSSNPSSEIQGRLKLLKRWLEQARDILPVILKILES